MTAVFCVYVVRTSAVIYDEYFTEVGLFINCELKLTQTNVDEFKWFISLPLWLTLVYQHRFFKHYIIIAEMATWRETHMV